MQDEKESSVCRERVKKKVTVEGFVPVMFVEFRKRTVEKRSTKCGWMERKKKKVCGKKKSRVGGRSGLGSGGFVGVDVGPCRDGGGTARRSGEVGRAGAGRRGWLSGRGGSKVPEVAGLMILTLTLP